MEGRTTCVCLWKQPSRLDSFSFFCIYFDGTQEPSHKVQLWRIQKTHVGRLSRSSVRGQIQYLEKERENSIRRHCRAGEVQIRGEQKNVSFKKNIEGHLLWTEKDAAESSSGEGVICTKLSLRVCPHLSGIWTNGLGTETPLRAATVRPVCI